MSLEGSMSHSDDFPGATDFQMAPKSGRSSSTSFEERGHEENVHASPKGITEGVSRRCGLKGPLKCQVEECCKDLTNEKSYYQRHRICELHLKIPSLVVAGKESRFCQQCARFQVISDFEGSKRSCRLRLHEHNVRRRKTPAGRKEVDGEGAATNATTSEGGGDRKAQRISNDSGGGAVNIRWAAPTEFQQFEGTNNTGGLMFDLYSGGSSQLTAARACYPHLPFPEAAYQQETVMPARDCLYASAPPTLWDRGLHNGYYLQQVLPAAPAALGTRTISSGGTGADFRMQLAPPDMDMDTSIDLMKFVEWPATKAYPVHEPRVGNGGNNGGSGGWGLHGIGNKLAAAPSDLFMMPLQNNGSGSSNTLHGSSNKLAVTAPDLFVMPLQKNGDSCSQLPPPAAALPRSFDAARNSLLAACIGGSSSVKHEVKCEPGDELMVQVSMQVAGCMPDQLPGDLRTQLRALLQTADAAQVQSMLMHGRF